MSYDHINLIEELMGILDRQFMATHYKEHRPVGETHDPTDEVVMEPMVRSRDIYDALQTWRTKSSDGDCVDLKTKIWRTPVVMPLSAARMSTPASESAKQLIAEEVVAKEMQIVPSIKEYRQRLQDEYGTVEGLRECKDRIKPLWDARNTSSLCVDCGVTRMAAWEEIRRHGSPGVGSSVLFGVEKIWGVDGELCTHSITETRPGIIEVV